MKRVIFISHNASQSGAPLYLLHLIEWIKENYSIECNVLLQTGGQLQSKFELLGRTFVWDAHFTASNVSEKILSKIKYKDLSISYQDRLIKSIQELKPDLVVSNTIVSNKLAFTLKNKLVCPFVAIYHEMKFSSQFYYPDYIRKKYLDIFKHILAVNNDISMFIQQEFQYEPENISVIPPFFSEEGNKNSPNNRNLNTFNILLSGYGGWQKGFDLIGSLVANIKARCLTNKFSFTWVGEVPEDSKRMLEFELEQIKQSHIIDFPGRINNMEDYYSRASLFLSLSKEDSFPIVCLEAASYGLPILAFEGSGGITDFIKDGAGVCVPFLDLNKLVETIVLFESDNEFYIKKSTEAKRLARNYSINKIAPRIINILKENVLELEGK